VERGANNCRRRLGRKAIRSDRGPGQSGSGVAGTKATCPSGKKAPGGVRDGPIISAPPQGRGVRQETVKGDDRGAAGTRRRSEPHVVVRRYADGSLSVARHPAMGTVAVTGIFPKRVFAGAWGTIR
jgi:hypothetical protein